MKFFEHLVFNVKLILPALLIFNLIFSDLAAGEEYQQSSNLIAEQNRSKLLDTAEHSSLDNEPGSDGSDIRLDDSSTGGFEQRIGVADIQKIFWMYLIFFIVYTLVLVLTYYGAQTLGLYRFVKVQQSRKTQTELLFELIGDIYKKPILLSNKATYTIFVTIILKIIFKTTAYMILFSPAYIIAYSFKTDINTDSIIFMILLGVISNGLLINYSNKFFTFLVTESRRGYVLTAVVKNLNTSYQPEAVPLRSILKIRKHFPGHVLNHIFVNARYQYIPTVKEQGAFLISGLIIIEMALNIHNHLCYELLQNILYRNYGTVGIILAGIFLLVKITDWVVQKWYEYETKKYSY